MLPPYVLLLVAHPSSVVVCFILGMLIDYQIVVWVIVIGDQSATVSVAGEFKLLVIDILEWGKDAVSTNLDDGFVRVHSRSCDLGMYFLWSVLQTVSSHVEFETVGASRVFLIYVWLH